MDERDQIDVLCRIADVLDIPADLGARVMTDAIELAQACE